MASGQFGGDEGKNGRNCFSHVFHFARAATFVLFSSAFVTEFSCILAYNQCRVYAQAAEEKQTFFSRNRIFLAARQFHVTERATGPCLDDAVRSNSSSRSLGRLGLGRVPATARERALSLQRAALIDRRHSGLSPHEH